MLILAWRNILPTPAFPGRDGDRRRAFCRQLAFVRRTWRVLPLEEAVARLAAGRPPARSAVLTFDDGYLDGATIAADVLTGFGLPATFFVCPDFLDGSVRPWWERAAARPAPDDALAATLRARTPAQREALLAAIESVEPAVHPVPAMMGWGDALRLAERGFEIGSHGSAHANLRLLAPAGQRHDLRSARERLHRGLGVAVRALAYPDDDTGPIGEDIAAAARAAGHRCALTSTAGRNRPGSDPFALRRLVVDASWPVPVLAQRILAARRPAPLAAAAARPVAAAVGSSVVAAS